MTASGERMRAAVLAAPGRVEIDEVPRPVPGAGDVRVRVEGSGICASNIPVWEGREWFRYPLDAGAPGHEAWGVVDAIGSGVSGVKPGDRVALLSHHAYAEYDVASAGCVLPIPAALDGRPFPSEPLGCAMNIFARSGIQRGDTVAIVGTGFLGVLLTSLASRAGARVIAISRRAFSLDMARAFGAHETIPLGNQHEVIQRVSQLTDGRFADRVIECVGNQAALDLASEITRERGRLVIAGFHQDGPRQINMFLWNWRGLDVINAHEREPAAYLDGMRSALAAVSAGTLEPAPLFTHRYPLSELGDALDATRDRPEGFMKALVMV